MKGKITYIKDLCFLGEIENHSIILDDGKNSLSPMQALLLSLATCTAMDVVVILKKKRQNLEKLEIEIEGKRKDEYPKIFEEIKINYIFKGDLEEKACKDAIELSIQKYCSIANMLKDKVKIEYAFKIT
ncbi:MAG TPA: OsmC family peroxiredoxin [Thermoplasmatales archaeon]|nr:OsmC family peroxiredoxin [Thermoplasmatales archaeon]